ncbi:nuclear transport factor 2 family protein [Klenkia terrae]|uniref:nuclear transport factor 2 family protein n=1 Tax=Klenkia terrae TaxID=1052259 RepID=UPI001CD8DA1A|nr:nuclear transport factor 2 family protein [Klenkia terrae]
MSTPTDDGVRQAVEGELALLRPQVRSSAQAGELLHPDFVEFGSSGRVWTRPEIVAAMAGELSLAGVELVVSGMGGTRLADDVVHLTYRTERDGVAVGRSSVWRRTGDRWQIWFHQGTPLSPTAAAAPPEG